MTTYTACVALAFLVTAPGATYVMARGDHLEVAGATLSDPEFLVEYDYVVRRTLLRDASESPYLRAIAQPSFSSEWMVEVLEPANGAAQVRAVTARSPVWNGGKPKIRATSVQAAEIPAELAKKLRAIWVSMLREVRYPKSPTVGVDGTTYHFMAFVLNDGNLVGQTWSPPEDSLGGKLVMLSELLCKVAATGAEERPSVVEELAINAAALSEAIDAQD